MQADLVGRVKNTKLPIRNGLLALFESIVNSIYAIEERGIPPQSGFINITIERENELPQLQSQNFRPPIKSFLVEDNGIGFNDDNFESFCTLDSQVKAHKGAKGIGRVLWLKVFDYAQIESIYEQDGIWKKRNFEFRRTPTGVENHIESETPPQESPCTKILLEGFQDLYSGPAPKIGEAVAKRIVEHCLEFYLLDIVPQITLFDPAYDEEHELNNIFQNEFEPDSSSIRNFSIDSNQFHITDILLNASLDAQHELKFCGHNRVVKSLPLIRRVPHLNGSIANDAGRSVVYQCYIKGDFLDSRVDAERVDFQMDRRNEMELTGGPKWEDIEEAALTSVREYLHPKTEAIRKKAIERIKSYTQEREPRYRPLIEHKTAEIENISGDISNEGLDQELHKILSSWRYEIRRKVENLEVQDGGEDEFDSFKDEIQKVIGDLQEITKSDLADYVIHRATVLKFFQKLLGRQENGKFPKEDALHGLFFPLKKTSDEIDFEDHNLWIIDEKLAYHKYLASDIPFSKQDAPVKVDSEKRPDILTYTPGSEPFSSIVIVEFKRPERDDYSDEENPIRQILEYVNLIREGKAHRSDGSTIGVSDTVPFYCYVIATLTPKLKNEAIQRNFITAPDGQGFFYYITNLRAYIEVSSYRKVLDDATKRNKAFFDKLGIAIG